MKTISQFFVLALILNSLTAHADFGVLLHEGIGGGNMTGWVRGGHIAIEIPEACVDYTQKMKLKLCDENDSNQGVVVSRTGKNSAENWDWMAIPASVYIYGVNDLDNVPLWANKSVREALALRTYNDFFSKWIAPAINGALPPNPAWRDFSSKIYQRDMYSYRVKSSVAEVQKAIDFLNSLNNVSNFSLWRENCADLVGEILRRSLPDMDTNEFLIGDWGLTSPKGITQAFRSWALDHPERQLSILKYSQPTGSILPSANTLYTAENLLKNPRYAIPLTILNPAHIVFAYSYFRPYFMDPEKDFKKTISKKSDVDTVLGSKEYWNGATARVNALLTKAVRSSFVIENMQALQTKIDTFEVTVNNSGAPIMKAADTRGEHEINLSRKEILNGDPLWAFKILLLQNWQVVEAEARNRPTKAVFEYDYSLLVQAARKLGIE